jgi:tripeptidyl-peptidase I
VTVVGATTLTHGTVKSGEQAANFSGGGFSSLFERPTYQSKAVEHYLDTFAPRYGDSVFNKSGRGFPDVSALGTKLLTVVDGLEFGNGGTSASAPIFASIVNLLNEERLQQGKAPIGFLNPTLYKHPEMFNDITVRSSFSTISQAPS